MHHGNDGLPQSAMFLNMLSAKMAKHDKVKSDSGVPLLPVGFSCETPEGVDVPLPTFEETTSWSSRKRAVQSSAL